MAVTSFLRKNPLFRLALPLIAGIAVGWYCGIEVPHILFLSMLSVVMLLLGLHRDSPCWLFGVAACLFMFAAGLFVEEQEEAAKAPQWSAEKCRYSAQLVEEPVEGTATMKALADVESCDSSAAEGMRNRGRAYLYFPRSVEAEQLHAGSEVLLDVKMRPFMNAGNPAEFDIEKYYYIKGVSGYAFVGRDGWEYAGDGEPSLLMRAMSTRERVVGMYRSLSFEDEELALLSALTLGEKRDFPKELKESYSVAGASHILALSGMHLGVFYLLLVTLLPLRGTNRMLLLVREPLVVLLLWAFAFVAGLSPSIVRAAILFTLMSVGRCLHQDSSAVSSLSFAAIVMLLFSPHLLFDLSFQLSFAAVLSILLLLSPLQSALRVQERGVVSRYLLNLLLLTVAAQLGTLPFVWCSFGVFPVYFVLTNFVVVPLAFLLMTLAVMVWTLAFVPFLQQAVAVLLKLVVAAMNGCVSWIASLPGASLALPSIGAVGACCVALLLFMLAYSLVNKRRWLLVLSGSFAVLSFALLLLTAPAKEENASLIIYNNGKNPLLHAVCGDRNYLVSTVPQLDAEYEYVSSPFIKREKLDEPVWVSEAYADSLVQLHDGLLSFDGLKVRMVDNEHWRDNIYVEPADIVILCRGFLGPMSELVEVYPTGCLVLDASLYANSRGRILRECAALGLQPVDILSAGAMKVVSHGDSFSLVPMRGK